MADNAYAAHNVRGAVTYSSFTMAQAFAANERSTYKKADLAQVAPEVQLLLDKTQQDRLVKHLLDTFLPEITRRHAAGEKKNALEPKLVAKIVTALEGGEADGWESAPPHLPIKKVYVKTKVLAPWAVGTLKFTGSKGVDIDQQARVVDESELKVPDPNLLSFPVLLPIGKTVHDLYPGAWAYTTLNLATYYQSANNFGISAYSNSIVFLEDRDRLAGGVGLDMEDVFMDE